MAILKTLLTIGTVLGKVCQTISGAVAATVQTASGECIVQASYSEVNGVRFIQKTEGEKSTLCAFNVDPDHYACVTYPNGYGKAQGDQIFIKPLSTVDLNVSDWSNVSTDIPFQVQKLDLSNGSAAVNNRVLIAFLDFRLDGTTLQITNTSLKYQNGILTVVFPMAGLNQLIMAELTSENGISATIREQIEQYKEQGHDPEIGTTEYEFDITSYGFTKSDTISGVFQFSLTADEAAKLKAAADAYAEEHKMAEIDQYMCRLCGVEQ